MTKLESLAEEARVIFSFSTPDKITFRAIDDVIEWFASSIRVEVEKMEAERHRLPTANAMPQKPTEHDPMTTTPTANTLLQKAAEHMAQRASTYDKPDGERSMGRAVEAFNHITGHRLTEPEGWLLLQVLKDVRLFSRNTYHADSAEDCIAYAALKAEAKARETAQQPIVPRET